MDQLVPNTPRQYQIDGVKFLLSNKRTILTDDPGLGKTVQGLLSIKPGQATLVVCPKSAKDVWFRECKKWRPDLSPIVVNGRNGLTKYPDSNEVLIVNPDIMPKNITAWGIPSRLRLLVDEAHMYKSHKTMRSKMMNQLTRTVLACDGSISFFTGTPITSNPMDLWGILNAINLIPETYGNFNNFIKAFRGVLTPFGYKFGQPHPLAMNSLRPFMWGRKRENVAKEIPPKSYEFYPVEVETKLVDNINISEDELEDAVEKGQPMVHLSTWRRNLALAKAQASIEYIDDVSEEQPVVVFSAHRDAATLFGNRPNWGLITGETPVDKRNALVASFQAGNLKGIAGTVGAMGVAITLTKSHRLFMIDRDWNPALNTQAEDRVCRLGQNNGVIITDVLSSSKLDQMITNVLIRKSKLIKQTVDVLKE